MIEIGPNLVAAIHEIAGAISIGLFMCGAYYILKMIIERSSG